MTRVSDHPIRDGLDRMDRTRYADEPHEIWSWVRRAAPGYQDSGSGVVAEGRSA